MRRRNWRLVLAGFVLIIIGVVFYCLMLSMATKSNDPVALMKTVGQVSGFVIGLSVVLIIFGLIGKKVQQ